MKLSHRDFLKVSIVGKKDTSMSSLVAKQIFQECASSDQPCHIEQWFPKICLMSPEGAISLEKLPARAMAQSGALPLTSTVRAVSTGCSQPQITLPLLDDLTTYMGGDPALHECLMNCHVYKTITGQEVPTQVVVS